VNHWIAWIQNCHYSGWDRELFGYMASALVLATFSMTSMRPLRLTAIASNLAFIFYAFLTDMHPILVLHGILLPLNIYRLVQIELVRAVRTSVSEATRCVSWRSPQRSLFHRWQAG
jgi:hypothetical protein